MYGDVLHRSFHGDLPAFKEIVDAYDWDFCQIQYNYLDEQNQAGTEGLRYAATKGLGVVIMEPLRGGNLGRKVPPAVQSVWDQADVKRSPAEWALRWIWNHPEVTVVLSGMNREDHVEENIRIAGQAHPDSLSAKELSLVSKAAKIYKDLMKVPCTGCRYCMPCPSGVDIPSCFEIYNHRHVFNDRLNAMPFYLVRVGGVGGSWVSAYASQCEECGQCREACPQHLEIPELLKDVAEDFEGPVLKILTWVAKAMFSAQRWKALRQGARTAKR